MLIWTYLVFVRVFEKCVICFAIRVSISRKFFLPEKFNFLPLRWQIRAETPKSWNSWSCIKTRAGTAGTCFCGVKGVSFDKINYYICQLNKFLANQGGKLPDTQVSVPLYRTQPSVPFPLLIYFLYGGLSNLWLAVGLHSNMLQYRSSSIPFPHHPC